MFDEKRSLVSSGTDAKRLYLFLWVKRGRIVAFTLIIRSPDYYWKIIFQADFSQNYVSLAANFKVS